MATLEDNCKTISREGETEPLNFDINTVLTMEKSQYGKRSYTMRIDWTWALSDEARERELLRLGLRFTGNRYFDSYKLQLQWNLYPEKFAHLPFLDAELGRIIEAGERESVWYEENRERELEQRRR